jgi:hypothetical protein
VPVPVKELELDEVPDFDDVAVCELVCVSVDDCEVLTVDVGVPVFVCDFDAVPVIVCDFDAVDVCEAVLGGDAEVDTVRVLVSELVGVTVADSDDEIVCEAVLQKKEGANGGVEA